MTRPAVIALAIEVRIGGRISSGPVVPQRVLGSFDAGGCTVDRGGHGIYLFFTEGPAGKP